MVIAAAENLQLQRVERTPRRWFDWLRAAAAL
jgi:hypothetical protein